MSLTPSYLADLATRRHDRILAAWTSSSAHGVDAVWRALTGSRNFEGEVDGFERASFDAEVAADVHAHGAPRDLDGFVAHYNRLVERRSTMIEQSFSMEAKLGEGAYATVVRAHRKPSSKESVLSKGPHGGVVALKLVQKSSLTDSVAANLENEIASWGAVRHVGVCELLGTFETPSLHVLAIELCEGGCLLDQLEDLKTFNEEHARQISRQLTNAVIHLHHVGVVHRDIKPENVLCTDREPHLRGHVKLCDFGFASAFAVGRGAQLTQLVGTPEYLAPEMVRALMKRRMGRESPPYTEAVDLWALGCLLYELLAGEPPFLHDDDDELYRMTLTMPVPFPRSHFGGVSEDCAALLRALLEREATTRLAGEALRNHPWLVAASPTPIRGLTFAERADAAPPLLERIESAVKTREMRARRRIKARFNQIQAVTRLSISAAESRRPSEGDLAAAAAAAAEVPTPRAAEADVLGPRVASDVAGRTGSPTRRGG